MKRAAVYLRVSTAEQVEGTSLETQRRTCKEYCERNDMDVVQYFEDRGESAKTADRPEFQRLLKYCSDQKAGIDFVVAYRLDRLARNNFDFAVFSGTLAKYGTSIRSATEPVTDDPTGRFMQTVLSAIAELDNDIRGIRAKDGMARVAEKGGWAHFPPIGYRTARDPEGQPILVVDPIKGPLVRELFEELAKGTDHLTAVRARLNKKGWKDIMGLPLYKQQAHRMLANGIYCGRITGKLTGGKVIKSRFLPLVNEATFDRVQLLLAGRCHVASPHLKNNQAFPLRKFVRCSKCDTPLTASFTTNFVGKKYAYYRCPNSKCLGVNITKDALENNFRELLQRLVRLTEPQLNYFRQHLLKVWRGRHEEVAKLQAVQHQRLEKLEALQRTLLDKLLKGIIPDELYETKSKELAADIAVCRVEAHDAQLDRLDIEGVMNTAEYVTRNMTTIWDKLDIDNRQRFQAVLFPDGLTYSKTERFGTEVTCPFINTLRQNLDDASQLAPPA